MIRKLCGVGIVLILAGATAAWACNVPVFRYALERWNPDPYEIVVLHRGELSIGDKETVTWLGDVAEGVFSNPANFTVRTADLASEDQTVMRELWERSGSPELPCAALRYPGAAEQRLAIQTVPLTREMVETFVDSPVRSEIARRIKDGESAVWIFLESGDKIRDERAYTLLKKDITELESLLALPGPVAGNEAGMPVDISIGPDIRIDFSIVRLSRSDPAEHALFAMLIHTEPDLVDYPDQPMAFPVYGRGRALYALVGEGITTLNIESACRFLVGACSCEVKALNPGVDLLVATDWDGAITESWIQEDDLPPLVGIAGLVEAGADTVTSDETSPAIDSASISAVGPDLSDGDADDTVAGSGRLMRNMLIALGALFAVAAGLTFAVVSRRKGRG